MTMPANFMTLSARQKVVAVAQWGVANHAKFSYTQGPHRWDQITRPWQLPIMTDCSGWATTCYAWSHLPDPNGQNFSWGWTGTLATHGAEVQLANLEVGDLVIYWDNPAQVAMTGASSHVAVIVAVGSDPLTVSMGQNGDPSTCRVSQDGRAHRFFRYLPSEKKKP
jgi:hypothetical protein